MGLSPGRASDRGGSGGISTLGAAAGSTGRLVAFGAGVLYAANQSSPFVGLGGSLLSFDVDEPTEHVCREPESDQLASGQRGHL